MRSIRRVTQRVAPAFASIASLLLFATCDFDKISGTPTALSLQDVERIFSITPTDTTITLGATRTLAVAPGTGVSLAGTTTRWFSSSNQVVRVDSVTGVALGLSIGTASVTARILAPELDTGYARTRQLRVRYKAIRMAPLDSIAGKNLSRLVVLNGTNNTDQLQQPALTGVTLSVHDSGSTNTNVAQISGTSVVAKNNGLAYVVALFDNFRDSAKVKIRQVAKSLTFPLTDYTANSLNVDRQHQIILKDVNDETMTSSPVMQWSSSDTSVVTINSVTGVLRVKKRDTARVFVRVDTVNRSQKVVVQQVTASLTKFTADPRGDTVARLTTVLPTVTALDSGSTPVAGDTVIFRRGVGRSVITDSVKLTDVNGRAALGSWRIGDTVGTFTVIAASRLSSTTFTTNAVPQRAFGLRFTAQASDTAAAAALSSVRVSVVDSLGNVVTSSSAPVTLALANNPTAATLGGTRTVNAVNGVATFAGLSVSAAGNGYTMTATAAGVTSAISNAFGIYGAATKLAFLQQPSNATTGVAIGPAIRVAFQDALGTTVKNATSNVTLSIGTNPGATSLSGTTTVAAVGGVATFSNVSMSAVANGYTLVAASTGLTSATSNTFNIRAVGTAAKLAFLVGPPTSSSATSSFPSAVQVEVQDADGGRVTNAFNTITLAIETNAGGGTLTSTSTLSLSPSSGVATFTGVRVNKTGVGYKLKAIASNLSQATSTAFTITPGTATKLGFTVQPSHVNPSLVMTPTVEVAIQDSEDNTVTTQTPTNVALTASSGTLGGATTKATANGVATFDNLTLAAVATNLTLTASAAGTSFPNVTSSSFNVVAASGGAYRLRWVGTPSTTAAGNNIGSVQVEVIDNAATPARVTSSSANITLSVATGPGSFDQTSTLSTFASSGLATFTFARLLTAGTYTINASSTGFPTVASGQVAITAGSANNIGFVVQPPATLTSGGTMTPAVQVAVRDVNNNTVTTATNTVTLSYNTAPAGAVTAGTMVKTAVNGIATFDNLSASTVGNYRLNAAAGCCVSVNSDFFTVAAGTPVSLGFEVQPGNVTAGSNISPSVRVRLLDASGNVVTTATNAITVALTGGDATATLSGTATQTPTSGVAIFNNLNVDKIGTGYRLSASATGFTTVQSNTFNVTTGFASRVRFKTQPSGATGGGTFSVAVEITDAGGNPITTDNRTVLLSIESGTGTAGASLSGTTQLFTTSGVATFNTITIDKAGTAYKLRVSEFFGQLTGTTSNAFDVTVGAATKLVFTTQPPSQVNGGGAIAPAMVVSVTDAGGNVVTGATNSITLTKDNGPFGSLLSGTVTKAAVAGMATFDDIVLDKAGNGYRLVAATTGLQSAFSNFFDAVAGPAAGLGFNVQPTNVGAGSTFSPTVQIKIQDAGGNTVTGNTTPVTVKLTAGDTTAILSGTKTVTPSSGLATFSDLTIDKLATGYKLEASATGFTTVSSNAFDVTLGSATKLRFKTQPVSSTGGGSFSIAVEITDAAGNVVTNNNRTINLSIESGTGTSGATVSGTTSVFSSNGVATFNNVSVDKVGTGYKIRAADSFSGFTPAVSTTFDITQGPAAKLVFTAQPTQINGAATISPAVQVSVTDQGGNLVNTATHSITLTKTGGNSLGILSGTLTKAAVAGVATFNDLSIDKNGFSYQLLANVTGLAQGTSSSFDVIVGPKAKLVVTSQPTSVTAGSTFNVTVAVADAGGNTVTSATDIISIAKTAGVSGSTLGGTLTLAASGGSASFNSLTLDKSGSGYVLTATSGTLTSAPTTAITVNAGSLTKIAWTLQPAATFINAPLVPPGTATQPQITLQDAQGNTVTNNNQTVRIAIQVGPQTTFKSGTSTVSTVDVTPVSGVATIPTTVTMAATGPFTLRATIPFWNSSFADATSFTVAAFDTKIKLGFIQQPTNAGYDIAMSPAVTVAIQDQYGNTVTTASDQIQLEIETDANPTTTLSGGGLTSPASGIATFSSTRLNKTGTGYKLRAKSTLLTSASSNTFNVTSPGTVVGISTTPSTGSFVVGGGNLFWSDNQFGGSIRKVSATGSSSTAVYTTSATRFPGAVVSDGTNIYWVEDGSGAIDVIQSMPIAGGAVNTILSGLTNLISNTLALDSINNNLIFVAQQQSGTNYAVKRISKTASFGTATDVAIVGTSDPKIAVANSGGISTIYYFDPLNNQMRSVPALGGSPVNLLSAPTTPRTGLMRVAGSNLYWLTTSNALLSVPTSGGSSTTRVSASFCGTTAELLNDGSTSLYYRDNCFGMQKFTIGSGGVTTFHSSFDIMGLASDGTNLFWLSSSTILKAPK